MKIKTNKIKVGEEYFFIDTDFTYPELFNGSIKKERINKIIDGEFSTRNVGDKYERQRYIGFTTEKEATEYLIREIKDRKKQIDNEYKKTIQELLKSNKFSKE